METVSARVCWWDGKICVLPPVPSTFWAPGASLLTQLVQNPLVMQETQVQLLGREDPLEEEMAAHSGLLAWRLPWTEEPGGLQSTGSQSQTQLSNYTTTIITTTRDLNQVRLIKVT